MKTPLPHSYWVEPGRFLAGEHPHGGSERATRERLELLVAAGVSRFIDLTEEGELPAYQQLLPPGVEYHRQPFRDHSVPQVAAHMRRVMDELMRAAPGGGAVYVHCRAGIGRTGMAVGCYLRERGATPSAVLAQLNELWKHNKRAATWPWIPETEEQEDFILKWKVDAAALEEALPQAVFAVADTELTRRQRGCLIGVALGDAMGNAGADSGPALQWTDDAGITLCTLESLLACHGFDVHDQVERYRKWEQDPAAAGSAAGSRLRPAMQQALMRALRSRGALAGSHDPAQVDASLLPRCAAVALYAPRRPQLASSLTMDITRITSQVRVAMDACRLFTAMIGIALEGGSLERIVAAHGAIADVPLVDEVRAVALGWQAREPGRRAAQRGLLGTLDRATRSLLRARDFHSGLQVALAARSADRDALGATYGALAGAFFGVGSVAVPGARLAGIAHVERVAGLLYQHQTQVHGQVG
jgi:ADP-ribosylglycohydrolase